ncbi:MAG: hypothetical protein MUE68_04165 [Bacteroidetes bacterium]|nr:hypothetical protein [Bacteroidota bacterium]
MAEKLPYWSWKLPVDLLAATRHAGAKRPSTPPVRALACIRFPRRARYGHPAREQPGVVRSA